MKENIIYIILGFFIGFVFTAILSPKAEWTINQVMKNKTVEVNKTYLDSIATLNQELDYHKDLVRTKEHERMAYDNTNEWLMTYQLVLIVKCLLVVRTKLNFTISCF